MRLGRVYCSLVLLALGVLIPFTGDADATPFTILPGGNLEIDTAFTTNGVFFCAGTVPCSGSGTNSVVLGSGASTATLTFTGVSIAFPLIASTKTHVAPIGVFNASATSGFTFPIVPSSPNAPLLSFSISIEQSSPVAATRLGGWSYGLGGGGTELPARDILTSYLEFPIGSPPPGYLYSSLVYTFEPFPSPLPSNGVVDMGADIGAIPEPTTLLLFGTTMAGLGLAARWRKRKQN